MTEAIRGKYSTPSSDVLPPHSVEAEEAVLGSLLIDPDAVLRVSSFLQVDDFYRKQNGWIYQAILSLYERREPADFVTLRDELERKERLKSIGGSAEITRLINAVPTALHVENYAHIVVDYSIRRRLIAAGADIARIAYGTEGDIDQVLTEVRGRFDDAMPRLEDGAHLTGDAALVGYLETLSRRAERLATDPNSIVRTGWASMDDWMPFEPGALYVVGGGAGVGKTMFMECVAEHNARRGKHVAFYHFELSHDVMLDRRMARHSAVNYQELRRGYAPEAVHAATQRLSEWQANIVYVHCPGWTMSRVAADIARLDFEWGLDLVFVDYLQKAALSMSRGLNEASVIGLIVERLKNVAETAAIPIMLGSQLNRSRQGRSNQKPHVADLRKSGEVEEKANVVLLLHRAMEGEPPILSNMMEVFSGKNTFSWLGHCWLQHQPGLYRLDEVQVRNVPIEELGDSEEEYYYND